MGIKYQLPCWLQCLYRDVVWRGDCSRKVVYLTFDDGPIPEVTPALLDILHNEGVHATFFMVAENAMKYPDIYHQVLVEGHCVGNHTYNHLKGTCTSLEEYIDNVQKADIVLGGTKLFRPPYGKLRPRQKTVLLSLGYRIILWDILTHDYDKAYSADQMFEIVKRYTRNGSIINFHDSIKSNERMLETIPRIITYLRDEGYVFETL